MILAIQSLIRIVDNAQGEAVGYLRPHAYSWSVRHLSSQCALTFMRGFESECDSEVRGFLRNSQAPNSPTILDLSCQVVKIVLIEDTAWR